MAKGKKKRRNKVGSGANRWDALAAAALATLGNTIGQLIADGAEGVLSGRMTSGRDGADANGARSPSASAQRDIAADLLQRLQRDDGVSIADLYCACGTGLSSTVEAVRALRDVRLVEIADDGLVRLTDGGRATAHALSGDEPRAGREAVDEESEAFPE